MKVRKNFAYELAPVSTDFVSLCRRCNWWLQKVIKHFWEYLVALWRRYNWWLYCIFVTLTFGLLLYYLHPHTDQDNARYILSAISQGLAAILALVFTITLVVAQMTRRYTAMDKIIFRPETIVLMIIFGLGVVTPLLVLRFSFWAIGVNLAITLAVFCVFSLIPFLKGVNGVLKYDIGVINLKEEMLEAINLNQRPRLSNRIDEINDIGESALRDSREDVVLFISQALSTAGIRSAKKEELWPETYQLVEVLINLGVKSVEKDFQAIVVIEGLSFIGERSEISVERAIDGILEIGVKAAEKGLKLKGTVLTAVRLLEYVGKKSENNEALIALWCLGAAVKKYMFNGGYDVFIKVIRNLEELEKTIEGDWVPLAESICLERYPDLKDSFKKFKDERKK